MQWSETIKEYLQQLHPVKMTPGVVQRIVELIDLTSLNATDTTASIATFLEKAQTPVGHVAAVCVAPDFVQLAAAELTSTPIKTATVANFPQGSTSLDDVLLEIGRALGDGAQEVDVVFPYERYLAGERQYAQNFVMSCKAACGDDVTLKIILETGVLSDLAIIADASYDALAAGADFIKTSTGKVEEGASLEAVATMLLVAKHVRSQLQRPVGIKVSGGVQEPEQAAQYIELADLILTREQVTANTFRIGASKLLDRLLELI